MAKFCLNSLHKTKGRAILKDVRQDYSVGFRSMYFKEYFTKHGTIITEQSYSSGDQDFKGASCVDQEATKSRSDFVSGVL